MPKMMSNKALLLSLSLQMLHFDAVAYLVAFKNHFMDSVLFVVMT